ncbi:lipoprotein BA_5634 family protein [Paraclostridium ghonii]|uniref:lipoprotein BA_5634 family protein n=1 Tax=Paraclostridium ghonii TaxID=29358 RepID=UPI00202CEA1A|nr:lipoprotein BA_5634 family protein [Paeniclostridium ghonii]MCM0167200.1 lipoprotein BA_5634 family protein [Paeniclostridium ghonii]
MKKTIKWIIGIILIMLLVVGTQQGLKYYLQGPPRIFNAILISGNAESVTKGKEVYKDNTKYTKDYKYKVVSRMQKSLDENGNVEIGEDGKEVVYEIKSLIITKDTAKKMLKDQVLRELKDPEAEGIETKVLESIPNIDTDKTLYFGSEYKGTRLEINGKDIPLEYGSYSWIGYYPSEQGVLMVTDDETYKSIKDEEKDMSLIRFAKGKKDLRNAKDKQEINKKLINTQITEINYANVE